MLVAGRLPIPRASGGIGRRAGFRCQCPKGRGGSSPPSRTQRSGGFPPLLFSYSWRVLLEDVAEVVQVHRCLARVAERARERERRLAGDDGARDALAQTLGLVLRPDLAVQAVPELVGLLKSGALGDLVALLGDLLKPCEAPP